MEENSKDRTSKEVDRLLRALPWLIHLRLIGTEFIFGDGNDTDLLAYVDRSHILKVETELKKLGYELESNPEYEFSRNSSYRKGRFNLILTERKDFYDGFRKAMEVCKYLQLSSRYDRIAVCKMVRDDIDAATTKEYIKNYQECE